MKKAQISHKGQSAIEYLILATAIVIVVLVGFNKDNGFMLKAQNVAEGMMNQSVRGIMGTVAGEDVARSDIDSRTGSRGYP